MLAAIPFPPLSPDLISFSVFGFTIALRWYALAYIVGILIGWRLAVMAVKRPALWRHDTPPMQPAQVEDLLTWVILGVILGGRLGFVLFYQPGFYLENPSQILMIWQGGMSFHGGLMGVVIAALVYCWRNGLPLAPTADMMALATPPGLLLGRIANFINAELWGRPTDLPWGVIFPGAAAQDCANVVAGACARHPSQLYEALLEGLILGAVLLWLAFRRGGLKRPGMIAALFFAGYGLARFLVEFVRQPDAQFVSPGNPLGLAWHLGGYGLTIGQILSLPMLLAGLAVVLWLRRRA
ncbi:prolipoprotein diacylglyceryl transferase [Thalassococcus sp. BH17M4-6]|uniref:prolipoprotein diacylglyceryl transferase n=1 Tax=Thalassococcus sp. BH17M4-6 TaxID=3413148 RepID=UPI003BE5726B